MYALSIVFEWVTKISVKVVKEKRVYSLITRARGDLKTLMF